MNKKNLTFSSQPPAGTRDFLIAETENIDRVANTLLDEFSRWGYGKVITPSIDFLDVFLLSSKASELFKIADISTGEMLSLRSDFTPQIARLSSALKNSVALPYKFSYCGPVLRNLDPVLGRPREIWQAGVESVGPESAESDAELIIMGIESLKRLGVKDFSVDIGNVEFFKGIVSEIEHAVREKIEEFILRKDSSGLNVFLESASIPLKKKEVISELPFIFGEKSVIKKAWKMASDEKSQEALEILERILSYIKHYKLEKYITIDLGEIRGLNYYTGTIFECFAPHVGYEIFGGGRYNNLIGRFGENCAGAGFAVNLDTLCRYGDFSQNGLKKRDFLVFNKTDDKKTEVEIILFLRKKGYAVETNFMDYGYLETVKYMKENRIKKIINIAEEHILLGDINTGKERKFKNITEFKKFTENI